MRGTVRAEEMVLLSAAERSTQDLMEKDSYYPAKITDNLLNSIIEQVQQSNEKPITFSPK